MEEFVSLKELIEKLTERVDQLSKRVYDLEMHLRDESDE